MITERRFDPEGESALIKTKKDRGAGSNSPIFFLLNSFFLGLLEEIFQMKMCQTEEND